MSKNFYSWSKEKVEILQIEIKSLLESLDPHSKVFMSEKMIFPAGTSSKENHSRDYIIV